MVDTIIGHWALDEESGSIAYDSTSNGYDGIVTGTSIEWGLYSRSRVFSAGTQDRIDIDNSSGDFSFSSNDFTISVWFKTTSTPSVYQTLFSRYDNTISEKSYLLAVDSSGHLKFVGSGDGIIDDVSLTSTKAVNDGNWHLVTVTRRAAEYSLYVDEAIADQDLLGPVVLFGSSAPILIGNASESTPYDSSWDGYIDDVVVYNYALSDAEVSKRYYIAFGDWEPPDFTNLVPNDGAAGVPIGTDIEFDFIDAYGANINTLDAIIYGGAAILNGVQQDGYSVSYTAIAGGYHVSITPLGQLPSAQVIDVSLSGNDNTGIAAFLTYTFKTVTDLLPDFQDISPVPYSADQDENENILITISDPAENGILKYSIDMHVNFAPVILDGVPQDGYVVDILPNPTADGYDIVVYHDRFEPYSRVFVSIAATNFDGNSNSLEYYYDVGEKSFPDVVNQDPAAGATGVPIGTDVCFDVTDYSGVDINGLTVYIDGQLAFKDASFIHPFDDVNSYVQILEDSVPYSFLGSIPIYDPVLFHVPTVQYTYSYFDETLYNDGYVWYDGYSVFYPSLVNDGIVVADGYIDGYDGYDGYMLDGYADGYDGYIGIAPNIGYRFCFDYRGFFTPGTEIEVVVHAADLLGNEGNRSYSFTIVSDTGPPAFENVSPFSDETGVALDAPLTFDFVDTFSGAVLSSLNVVIANRAAITAGEFQDGYTGSTVFYGDGYHVSVVPDTPLPNYTLIPVSLYGEDLVGNSAQFDFEFQTQDALAPIFDGIYPAPGSLDIPTDTSIRFSFNDPKQSGADLSSLDVRVLGSLVVIGGNALDGYEITATANAYGGYDIEVFLNADLPEYSIIDVVLSGSDNTGNFGFVEYSWKTADESPPVFDSISPIYPGAKASNKTIVSVDILDYGTGVNLDTLDFSVDSISIIDNGITLPNGFVTELTQIEDGYHLLAQSIGPLPHALTSSTVALYRMDSLILNNVENAAGDSSLNGTALGPTLVPGLYDNALEFTGGTDRVEIATEHALELQDFTIEAWIKPSTLVDDHTIYTYSPRQTLTNGRGVLVQVTAGGALKVAFGDGTGVLSEVIGTVGLIGTGSYSHIAVAVSISEGTVDLYVNGSLDVSSTISLPYIQYSDASVGFPALGTVLIGNHINSLSGSFSNQYYGIIDDLKISDEVFTVSEIANSYNRGQDISFSEYAIVPVSISIQDFAGNDGYLDYTFMTLDETPPVFSNLYPLSGAVRVDPATNISFDFTDVHSGPDIDTLRVTIDGNIYVNEGLGYNAMVSVSPITDGYHIEIDLDADLPEFKNIIVILDGYDTDPNRTVNTYQFSTDDLTSPILTNELPIDGSIDINPFTNIEFILHDFNGSGVDTSTINVQVDDINAVVAGVQQNGWLLNVTPTYVDGYAGYYYSLNPSFRLSLDSNIRVLVDGSDAYGNYFASDFAFATYIDLDAPQVVNLDPYPNEMGVEVNRDISFDIIDGYDINLDRLSVYVDNVPAILGGVFQPGFQGPSSGIAEIADGYYIDIDPEAYLAYNQQVTVVVDGYDFSDNQVHFEYYFYTFADTNGPIISNRHPAIGEVEVAINSDVGFYITDPSGSGVDITKLDVHIDSIPVLIDGVIQSGWNGISSGIEAVTDGYHVVVDPYGSNASDYNQIHVVTIDGYDYADNHTNDIYTFATISDPNAPTLANFDPAPGEVEVPVATNISFDITDVVSGVDITRLDMFVNGIPAITDGTITSPFADTGSGIVPIADGYTVTLDLFSDFWWNELEDVIIDGYDYADNHIHYEYTFLTKVDVNGPVITPVRPLNSVGGYPRNTDIRFTITDTETGVDLSKLYVTVDNVSVVQDGVFVAGTGFDGAYSQATHLPDGYDVFLDSTGFFAPRQTVRVVVDGYDFGNNQTHFEYIFTTVDDVGPEIFDFSPTPDSVDASNDPVHVMFGIGDVGAGQVNLATLKIEVAEGADIAYKTVYEPINQFQNGWTGLVSNQPWPPDGYVVDMTRTEQGASFALYTFRITAADDSGNYTTTVVGKEGGLIASSTGTVTGFDTLEVGEFFLNSNQIDAGDIVLIAGVGALVVDGYTSSAIVFDRQIAAGGTVSFSAYRGSFMLSRRYFGPETVVPTSRRLLDLTYSDPPYINAAVLDPAHYSITGGDYPVVVTGITQESVDTFELTLDVPMQALVLYTLTVDSNAILNQLNFTVDDGYESTTFFGFPDIVGPRVLEATNTPYNINVTVVFDEAMALNSALTKPGNYLLSDGAYVTAVTFDPTENDRVVLTVENLYGHSEFDVFVVSEDIIDVFDNILDLEYNHAIVHLQQTGAALSGLTGRVKSRNAIRRMYEDSTNWYLATEGGIDVVSKLDLENKGYVLDGYGFNAITADTDAIYFGSNDGYDEDSYGVHKLELTDLLYNSSDKVYDAFNTMSVPPILSNEINDLVTGTHADDSLLVVATSLGVTIITNETTAINYSSGSNIGSVQLDDGGSTLYLANNTLVRVEVYYNIHLDVVDRTVPDVYYSTATSPEILGGTINQIKITNNTSIIDSDSNTIYVATNNGLTRINTDESTPGSSEPGGISFTYGISGSGTTFEILGGNVNRVVAVDINTQQNQAFVATDDPSHGGGLTTVNLPTNTRFSFASAASGTLASNDVRDVVFKNL